MIIAQSYTFTPGGPGEGTITVPATLDLEDFGVIINVSRGSILYDPQDGKAGAVASSQGGVTTLTLEQSTTYCKPTDNIQITILQGESSEEPAAEVRVTNSALDPVHVQGSVTVDSGSVAITDVNPTLLDGFGRIRTSQPFNLSASSHRYADNGQWSTLTAFGGTATFNANEGLIDLAIGTSSGAKVYRETYRVHHYQPGKGFLVKTTFTLSPAKENLRQRVGLFNGHSGIFLEKGATENSLCFVKRSSVSGSLVETKISRLGGLYGVGDTGWNIDKMDGNGPSGLTLDAVKSQIMFIDLEWLGVGSVSLGFMVNRKFVLCHRFDHSNIITGTYMATACLPVRYEIENVGITESPSTLKQICSTVESEGGYELIGAANGISVPIASPTVLSVAGTYYPVASIRLKSSRLDAIAILTSLSVMGTGNNEFFHWKLINNPEIAGGSWNDVSPESPLEYNLGGSLTGGRTLMSGYVSSSKGSSPLELSREALLSFQLERDGLNNVASPVSLVVASANANQRVYGSLDWHEVVR